LDLDVSVLAEITAVRIELTMVNDQGSLLPDLGKEHLVMRIKGDLGVCQLQPRVNRITTNMYTVTESLDNLRTKNWPSIEQPENVLTVEMKDI
jgi:hypothetical protein